MSNGIGSSRESNPSRTICHLRATPLGHVAVTFSNSINFFIYLCQQYLSESALFYTWLGVRKQNHVQASREGLTNRWVLEPLGGVMQPFRGCEELFRFLLSIIKCFYFQLNNCKLFQRCFLAYIVGVREYL